jgi:hypothetical protein
MIIVVVNESTKVTRAEAHAMTRAVGYQMHHHVAPSWNLQSPHMLAVDALKDAPEDALIISLLDHADQADALGYHDLTPDGRPYARVFVEPSLQNNAPVSSVLSHEAAEMLVDPLINAWSSDADSALWATESSDPVEDDLYDVTVYGEKFQVSNFVLPEWFTSTPAPGAQFDYLGKLKQPFALTKGGYAIKMHGGKVSIVYGDVHTWRKATKLHPASRTAKRLASMGAQSHGTETV